MKRTGDITWRLANPHQWDHPRFGGFINTWPQNPWFISPFSPWNSPVTWWSSPIFRSTHHWLRPTVVPPRWAWGRKCLCSCPRRVRWDLSLAPRPRGRRVGLAGLSCATDCWSAAGGSSAAPRAAGEIVDRCVGQNRVCLGHGVGNKLFLLPGYVSFTLPTLTRIYVCIYRYIYMWINTYICIYIYIFIIITIIITIIIVFIVIIIVLIIIYNIYI